jgi:hypothetical protein
MSKREAALEFIENSNKPVVILSPKIYLTVKVHKSKPDIDEHRVAKVRDDVWIEFPAPVEEIFGRVTYPEDY